jgi:hypothetical protein
VSDIDIAVADSLKVLDLKRPIREATKRSKNLARLAPFGAAVPRCSDRVPARSRVVRSEALRIAMKKRIRAQTSNLMPSGRRISGSTDFALDSLYRLVHDVPIGTK